jgi:predicted nucleic acid-binding protein
VLRDERDAPGVRALVAAPGQALHAPHLLDVEVASAVRRKLRLEEIRTERAAAAIGLLRRLRVTRYSHSILLDRAWDLRDEVTVYDAMYVALSERLGVPLLTLDTKLARAARRHVRVAVPGERA